MNTISLFPKGKIFVFSDLYGEPCENQATFQIAVFGEYLRWAFRCWFKEKPKDMTAVHGKKVYRDECVELFIGSRERYYEIDVSAYNMVFSAFVENPNGDDEPPAKEIQIEGLETSVKIGEAYYEVVCKVPMKTFAGLGELYFNAFRVEMQGGERVSRTISQTNSNSHHKPASFLQLGR